MLLDDLRAQCERNLTSNYELDYQHVYMVGKGWTHSIHVRIGPKVGKQDCDVTAESAILTKAIRAASESLKLYVETFMRREWH